MRNLILLPFSFTLLLACAESPNKSSLNNKPEQ